MLWHRRRLKYSREVGSSESRISTIRELKASSPGSGFVGPRAVYGINLQFALVAIEPERFGHAEFVKRFWDNTRHG